MNAFLLPALSGALLLATTGVAQPSGRESGAWNVTAGAVSQYLFRGLRLGGPAFQPGVEYDRPDAAIGLWASTPLADRVPGRSDPEIDPYAWYRIAINERLSVQPGVTAYLYPRADRARGFRRATFEPNVAVTYVTPLVALTPKVYYDPVLRGATAEVGAASALPLGRLGTELDLTATVGTYRWSDAVAGNGPRTRSWGDYWQVGAAIPYQIGASRLSLGWAYAAAGRAYLKSGDAPRRANPLAARRGVLTLTYSRTF